MKCSFAVIDAKLVDENPDSRFLTMECLACRSGKNTHRLPISKEAIKDAAPTIKGVPLLAEFKYDNSDFYAHGVNRSEQCVGFFEEVDPEIVEQDGELYIKGKAKLWKHYFPHAPKILKKHKGEVPMSMEMQMLDFKNPTRTEDGFVNKFRFLGVTLLSVNPSIKGSKATVLTFSEMKDEYNKELKSDLEKFSEGRIEVMAQSYKVNTTELKDTPWGDVDKIELRDKVMSATNRASLVKKVYALVEDGWQTTPSEHLKYPIMELVGDTFYYNRNALASALAYAKQENEQSVINKIEALYKKFKLNMEDEMAETKKQKMAADIIEATEKVEEMAEDTVVEASEDTNIEEMEATETTVEASEKPEETGEEFADTEEPKTTEEDGEEAEEFAEAVPFAQSLLKLMDCATADERMACRETMSYSEDENIVMDRVCQGIAEFCELKEFKEAHLAEQVKNGVSEVLDSIKVHLSEKDFAEIEEKSKSVNFESLESFKVEAKAFAFEQMSAKEAEAQEADDVIKMGIVNETETPKNVFDRILGK